ncbi:hypothetical protein [Pseudodesulfovibrio tunisiensis]|uniref:hypothetical protein n=1 Tax=Pseudodesulfovibrio tunisiensis TaxID=463192 RepID=UPI001FB4FCAD|nr:hypothetical protein [Pseudodesulfovibrio tunisiensis]
MVQIKSSRLSVLFRREVVIVAFVAVSVINGIITVSQFGMDQAGLASALAVLVYAVLAFFTWKRQRLATWGLVILMLLNSVSSVMGALRNILADSSVEPFTNMLILITGSYFAYGALQLFQDRDSGK